MGDADHGDVAVTNGGEDVAYTPDASYCGADEFTYTLGGGDTATVSITVAGRRAGEVAAGIGRARGEVRAARPARIVRARERDEAVEVDVAEAGAGRREERRLALGERRGAGGLRALRRRPAGLADRGPLPEPAGSRHQYPGPGV